LLFSLSDEDCDEGLSLDMSEASLLVKSCWHFGTRIKHTDSYWDTSWSVFSVSSSYK
jgi:hypothetical protein